MSSLNVIENLSDSFKKLTSKPEIFLSVQDKLFEESKDVLKTLYDYLKNDEVVSEQPKDALPELITAGFDEEQIWQELELQNEGISNSIVKDVAILLSKKDKLSFGVPSVDDHTESTDDDGDSQSSVSFDDNIEEDDDEIEESDDETDEEKSGKKLQFTSEVDDDFFKLCEMENFCEKAEKEEEGKRKKNSEFDLFEDDDSEEERELVRYNDFFGPAKSQKESKRSKDDGGNKSVRFAEEEPFSEEEEEVSGQQPEFDSSEEEEEEEEKGPKSAFEGRQERLKKKIEDLEEQAISEKPWQLKGEITSTDRPQNSLLEEYVDFDRATRPAPVFTEKTTMRLEDIIKQRIKDKSWDDVIRKIKPVQDIREYRKKLVLDQEKSKLSLAEIYEQEYVKQREAKIASETQAEAKEEVEPPEHVEIRKMMKSLFSKLDALSNFHYTPKPVEPEIRIVSNLPAITMEDVAPISTSDATLLAPEEVKNKPKGELMNKEERTSTDKNRERRKKKLKQRAREKDKLKKEKVLAKMPLGLGNKYSKERAKKELDKLTKDKNVDKMVETQAKHLKSSSAFFNKLEDEVQTQIKRKRIEKNKKNKKLVDSISAKRIKL